MKQWIEIGHTQKKMKYNYTKIVLEKRLLVIQMSEVKVNMNGF